VKVEEVPDANTSRMLLAHRAGIFAGNYRVLCRRWNKLCWASACRCLRLRGDEFILFGVRLANQGEELLEDLSGRDATSIAARAQCAGCSCPIVPFVPSCQPRLLLGTLSEI
jgi:hypothetical protein